LTAALVDRAPLLRLRGLTKRFGAVVANDGVDLDLHRGEIHALLGENGAGKSTLVKMIYGVIQPCAGAIIWEDRAVHVRSPEEARGLGVGMVFQHFSLFDNLTVADNVALALPRSEPRSAAPARVAEIAQRFGLALNPGRPVWTLSAGERQRVEIARCLLQSPKLLILDEPTSVLTPQEADALFATLDQLRQSGCAILYISHKLEEVRRLCDRATVLRMGKVAATCAPREESAHALATMMVGAHFADAAPVSPHHPSAERLIVSRLDAPAASLHGVTLSDISFRVCGGEILGIAGVAGNGQSELFAVLSGETLVPHAEQIRLGDVALGRMGVTQRRRLGAAFAPEARNGHAAVGEFSLAENVLLSRHADARIAQFGVIDAQEAAREADAIIADFDVRTADGSASKATSLSGGNLQKFVVGREISRTPSVLVIDQPTWGVDAAAAVFIRQALVDLAAQGAAIVVISQDLDELLDLADRIAVIHMGRLSTPRRVASVTREELGLLMAGAGADLAH
jgi:ABC-type uncharacterized transport system ATPase subunit